jgi:exopolyphosphatase / guanosine-5'-triphosphate,3'-diphosphate pyrophosphatase
MPIFAAVDIGSNSVRLKIAETNRDRLKTVFEDREVTRLGAGVFANGSLEPQTMAYTIQVLQRFFRATQSYAVDRVRVVATSAVRDARNSRAFIDWVRTATGWRVEIISGLEEGRLIHLGILSNYRIGNTRALLIDLGGGSCELTLSDRGHIAEMVSLPIGAVRLTQTFAHSDPPRKNELEQMRGLIQREISRVQQRVIEAKVQAVVATSGTAAALSGLYRKRSDGDGDSKPTAVPQSAISRIAKELGRRNLSQRQALPGIGPKRAEIIIAGAMVYSELLEMCKLRSFRYLSLGLRDGLLAQMMADYNASSAMAERVESERQDALIAAAKHYGVDLPFVRRIRDLSIQLFRRLQPVHQLPEEYAEWLEAAAMLHEVGSYINRSGRRRHTYYVIAHSEIFGYTPVQRLIIAAISRYVGKSLPSPGDRNIRILPSSDQNRVPKTVALLRLARALDQGRRGAVANLQIKVGQDERVTMRLTPTTREGVELELWAVEQEKDYFREVFGRELFAEPA